MIRFSTRRWLWLSLFSVAACSPDFVPPSLDVPVLHDRFHGKYKAIQSTSNVAVDVNLDGTASTDLLREIPDLAAPYRNYLELRIYSRERGYKKDLMLMSQWWPEQEITIPANKTQRWEGEEIPYQTSLIVNYAMQSRVRHFSFSPDLKQIRVDSNDENDTLNAHRWVIPVSVTVIDGTDRIQIVNKRRLYTRQGVKDVTITTVYERFTMVT